ncbi:TetR family transcriptional regulator [Nonomuraea rubra]|uniref:TetR family transcriptional regulator n=1 Tax=Nonomuraea rubra TaxID=46180 RepID=UPI0033E5DCB5
MRPISEEDLTTRARIRDAAMALFAEQGVKATTIRGIAEAAKVSPGLVQHHFGTKEALRLACDEYVLTYVRRQVTTGVTDRNLDNPEFIGDVHRTAPPLMKYLGRALVEGSPAAAAMFDDLGLDSQLDTPQFQELAATLGGPGARISDVFFTFMMYVLSQLVAGAALVSALRARGEEAAGRAELLLSAPVGRLRWALSHLAYAIAGPVLLLGVLGAAAGLATGDLARVTVATLAYLPAVWIVVGIATLLFGLLPRLAAAVSWTVLGLFLVVDLLAEFDLAGGLMLDLSPFVHVPALLLGGTPSPAAPLLALTALAAALAAAGLALLRRRDLAPSS